MSDEIGRRNAAWADLKDGIGCSLYDAEKIAEEHYGSNLKMTILNKAGDILKAEWLDPSFGFFKIEGDEGFISTDQVRKLGIELWVMAMVDEKGNNVPLRPASENTHG